MVSRVKKRIRELNSVTRRSEENLSRARTSLAAKHIPATAHKRRCVHTRIAPPPANMHQPMPNVTNCQEPWTFTQRSPLLHSDRMCPLRPRRDRHPTPPILFVNNSLFISCLSCIYCLRRCSSINRPTLDPGYQQYWLYQTIHSQVSMPRDHQRQGRKALSARPNPRSRCLQVAGDGPRSVST
jgi:hypothetical protein